MSQKQMKAYKIVMQNQNSYMCIKVNKRIYVLKYRWYSSSQKVIEKISRDFVLNDNQKEFIKNCHHEFYDDMNKQINYTKLFSWIDSHI
ncbi:MAG: hypothetical protein LUF02_03815 [Erysipelotrichaceae bacterium]|nr:hypothetical protein [Erysipelotrichaceae bacterium]